jgi:23S rRNA (guanosine2251-2'-O)-methyltransferase
MKKIVILHNIRSAHNVGAIFRTADGAGVTRIFLSGYTPAPIDRFGRVDKEIAKTSLGAAASMPYETVNDIRTVIQGLKEEGTFIAAVEQTKQAIDFKTYHQTGDTAFIFGNEITGVDAILLELSDCHIHVPMNGIKESLNVSVCAGIILFH